jgi:NAD(P)H-dependent flavin oxidoreductase YrpB (nitropropane dioxygenase family)
MKSTVADMFSIEFPIFAFSHCRDVVAAVSNAGGFGVLGAVAHTPEELDIDLTWIESQTGGRPFGVDLLIPRKFATAPESQSTQMALKAMISDRHRAFVERLLADYDVPPLERAPAVSAESAAQGYKRAGLQVDPESMAPLIDVAFAHATSMLASALGTPPAWLVDAAHVRGIKVAALAGTVGHAVAHANAGVDVIIAQGTEAGGHTGEVSTLVLVPQVVDAVAPIPVLAAGGIGNGRQMAAALALGADGVWCGSIWLTTREAETSEAVRARMLAARSQDTVRTRSFTGKPCRVLRSKWTDAWEAADAPDPLPMPVQSMLSDRPRRRIDAMAQRPGSRAVELLSPFVGQVVGQMNGIRPAGQVVVDMVEELVRAWDRVEEVLAD